MNKYVLEILRNVEINIKKALVCPYHYYLKDIKTNFLSVVDIMVYRSSGKDAINQTLRCYECFYFNSYGLQSEIIKWIYAWVPLIFYGKTCICKYTFIRMISSKAPLLNKINAFICTYKLYIHINKQRQTSHEQFFPRFVGQISSVEKL